MKVKTKAELEAEIEKLKADKEALELKVQVLEKQIKESSFSF